MTKGLTTALLVLSSIALIGCRGSNTELIDYVTFGDGLPPNSTVVATKRDSGLAQDAHLYLIFDTDSEGVATFAQSYTGGPLDLMKRSRTELHGASSRGTWMDTVQGIPWDLPTISNGRFSRHEATNGFLSIDLDENRIYVFR